MTIKEIVETSKKSNCKDLFLQQDEKDYLLIEEIQNRIHLRKSITFKNEIDNFVKDNSLEYASLRLSREVSNPEDITTNGWWTLDINIEDPKTGDSCISDSLHYGLMLIASIFNNYYFEARINEDFEDVSMTLPLSNTDKIFDFLLPTKVLAEFRANKLGVELEEPQEITRKKMKV